MTFRFMLLSCVIIMPVSAFDPASTRLLTLS